MGMMAQILAPYSGSQFMTDLRWLVTILVTIAGALMTLYAVYIGYLFATASDEGKRRAAKTRLMKVLGSALIVFAMAAILGMLNVNFTELEKPSTNKGGGNSNQSPQSGFEYIGTPRLALNPNTNEVWHMISIRDATFEVDADYIIYNNGYFEKGSIQIVECSIQGPALPRGEEGSSSGWKGNQQTQTYHYWYAKEGTTELTVQCYNINGKNCLKGVMRFTYDYSEYNVDFYVELTTNSPNNIKFQVV